MPIATAADPIPRHKSRHQIRIEISDAHGIVIGDSRKAPRLTARNSGVLTFERVYQPGDQILVSGPSRMAVRVDDWISECEVFQSDSFHSSFAFQIPYGQGESAARSAYSQDSFGGAWHRITARELTGAEQSRYRNLAMNACDQNVPASAGDTTLAQRQLFVFPHASTNSVSRNLPDFQARNAIDGMTQNGHHGVWPYESWGPELRNDLWWRVDFGRQVELDKIRLMVRSDFPHDSYWQAGVIEFSVGDDVPVQILQTGEFQEFRFPKRTASWIRISKLVPADPAKWCSFIEVESWGRDLN